MIKYNPHEWFGLIFRFHKSETFQKMIWILLCFAIFCSLVVFFELEYDQMRIFNNTIQIHSLLGFVIGLLLVFRTNSAYDRWWEGRKMWGAMVNNARNFSIKINAVLAKEETESRKLYRILVPNYVYAMKEHLREGVKLEELEDNHFLSHQELKQVEHKPNRIAKTMYQHLHQLYSQKKMTGDQLITLDSQLNAFTDIIGACERIKKTPIPFLYNMFIKKFIFVYTITLPFGLAYELEYLTVPICTFILYVLGSLELLAEEIEDPFGTDSSDLDTDGMSATIKKNVIEILQ